MIIVCWRWVAPGDDARWGGVSSADSSALELALRLRESQPHHEPVHVITLGPPGAEQALRTALAAGADAATRIDAPVALQSSVTAAAIAGAIADLGDGLIDGSAGPTRLNWVICGDYSEDRGSGSTPAFIAADLDIAQALGLVAVDIGSVDGSDASTAAMTLFATRRLDGGRRERLEISAPAVISIEGSLMRLRRSSPMAELAAQQTTIAVIAGPNGPVDTPQELRAYRPRPRVLAAPAGDTTLDRVRSITGADQQNHHASETVELEPAAAAARVLEALRERGYLD